ncbi:MAG: protein tyrosine phosphatase family protein [Candidatus Krumholzibacteriota bacterium]
MVYSSGNSRVILSAFATTLIIVLAAGCAGNQPPAGPASGRQVFADPGFDGSALPDTVADLGKFGTRIYRDGRVYIGGQPDEETVRALPEHKVAAVINLRTPKEMGDTNKITFDEAALVDSLGLDYVWIPLGGKDHPYTPAAVDTFAAALERHPGPVLLHCRSASRASHLWAAYLVRHRGWDVSEAYARGEAIGIGRSAFSKLLDRKMKMVEGTF